MPCPDPAAIVMTRVNSEPFSVEPKAMRLGWRAHAACREEIRRFPFFGLR